jgi:hypothetical protein
VCKRGTLHLINKIQQIDPAGLAVFVHRISPANPMFAGDGFSVQSAKATLFAVDFINHHQPSIINRASST